MGTQDNVAIVRRFVREVLNANDFSSAEALFAPDFVAHGLPPVFPPTLDGLRQAIGMFHAAFPDWQDTEEEAVAADDRVVLRLTGRGTHRGAFMGIPPTGRAVAIPVMAIYRLVDGRIAEDRVLLDMFGLLQQLGALPAPPPSPPG